MLGTPEVQLGGIGWLGIQWAPQCYPESRVVGRVMEPQGKSTNPWGKSAIYELIGKEGYQGTCPLYMTWPALHM